MVIDERVLLKKKTKKKLPLHAVMCSIYMSVFDAFHLKST